MDRNWITPADTTDPVQIVYEDAKHQLNWGAQPGWPEVLAHIIPARTEPLGAVAGSGEISTFVDLNASFQFTRSGYDHSAQFLSNNMERQGYWELLLSSDAFNIVKKPAQR